MNNCVICGKANRCDDDGQQICSRVPVADIDDDIRDLIPITNDWRNGVLLCEYCKNLHVHKPKEAEDEKT